MAPPRSKIEKTLRSLLLVILGGVLCLGIEIGVYGCWKAAQPFGAITNLDYNVVQIADQTGNHLFDLQRGESKPVGYGTYKLTIPEAKLSFSIWKDSHGICIIHQLNGTLLLQTEGSCGIGGPQD